MYGRDVISNGQNRFIIAVCFFVLKDGDDDQTNSNDIEAKNNED